MMNLEQGPSKTGTFIILGICCGGSGFIVGCAFTYFLCTGGLF